MPQKERKPDFTLGADPEFAFVRANGSHIASASGVIDYAEEDCQFGVDGGGEVAEIRPSPSENPAELVGNIRRAMQRGVLASPRALNYTWKAGSMTAGHPTGGHIHFGTINLQNRRVTARTLVSMLDIYLAQIAILLEDPQEARDRRNDSDYGHLGDYRDQAWGIEYRSLGSWLTSPYVATAILALGKVVIHETLFNGLADAGRQHLLPDKEKFNEAKMTVLRERFQPLWKDITKFELFKRYAKNIGLMKRLISKRLTWFPKCGMRDAWGLVNAKHGKAKDMPNITLATVWDGLMPGMSAPAESAPLNPATLTEEQLT